MAWEQLREAAYTGPSGRRVVFEYRDVNRTTPVRNTAFEFAGVAGTYVQPGQRSGRRMPVIAYFSGADCDEQAAVFEEVLVEVGTGVLEHPLYGRADALPVGDIKRSDKLATEANITTVSVTFVETTGALYPTTTNDAAGALSVALDEADEATAAEFSGLVTLDTAGERVRVRNDISARIDAFSSTFSALARQQADIERQFNTQKQSILSSLDTLIGDPFTLAAQVARFARTPSNLLARIEDKMNTYRSLLDSITGENSPGDSNELAVRSLFVTSIVNSSANVVLFGSSAGSASRGAYVNRGQAVIAASDALEALDTARDWAEAAYEDIGELESPVPYDGYYTSAQLAAGLAISDSFSLKSRRVVTLSRNRTILDLSFELFGSTEDSRIEELITENRLSGPEILELQRGREIAYYR